MQSVQSVSPLFLLIALAIWTVVVFVSGALWYRRTLKRNPERIAELEADAAEFRRKRDELRRKVQ